MVKLLVHVCAAPELQAECVVARLKTPACQAKPVQYWADGFCRVTVVLLAARPTPPVLSAVVPLNDDGTEAPLKLLPLAGATIVAVGAVVSTVHEIGDPESTVLVVLPARSAIEKRPDAATLTTPSAVAVIVTVHDAPEPDAEPKLALVRSKSAALSVEQSRCWPPLVASTLNCRLHVPCGDVVIGAKLMTGGVLSIVNVDVVVELLRSWSVTVAMSV